MQGRLRSIQKDLYVGNDRVYHQRIDYDAAGNVLRRTTTTPDSHRVFYQDFYASGALQRRSDETFTDSSETETLLRSLVEYDEAGRLTFSLKFDGHETIIRENNYDEQGRLRHTIRANYLGNSEVYYQHRDYEAGRLLNEVTRTPDTQRELLQTYYEQGSLRTRYRSDSIWDRTLGRYVETLSRYEEFDETGRRTLLVENGVQLFPAVKPNAALKLIDQKQAVLAIAYAGDPRLYPLMAEPAATSTEPYKV